jgi:hypothetical protein
MVIVAVGIGADVGAFDRPGDPGARYGPQRNSLRIVLTAGSGDSRSISTHTASRICSMTLFALA